MTHIAIDVTRKLYNTAIVKLVIMVIVAATLEALCRMKLQAVSWLIVLIPVVSLTVITALSLGLLGLSPDIGRHKEGLPGAEDYKRKPSKSNPLSKFLPVIKPPPLPPWERLGQGKMRFWFPHRPFVR